jgi:DNA helicase II / ATP-dependent DNA helicase PcrA
MTNLLHSLNDKQSQAVQRVTGSTLVIAGAGSGKTLVLTRRVAHLIAQGVTPGQILCLTFTNKAAGEMNQRVRKLLEENGFNLPFVPPWKEDYVSAPLLCTFHSLGVRLLREFGDRIDLKREFTILDSDDQKRIAREIIKELNLDSKTYQPNPFIYFVSQCKQELLTADKSSQVSRDFLPVFHQFYRKYEQKLVASQAVDFDDLLLLPYLIMRDNPEVLQTLQDRWHHVMVDEFQDTNQAQFELVKLLSPKEGLS